MTADRRIMRVLILTASYGSGHNAAAQRTKRIRLGAAVVVLPFDHPLRSAEDYAMVDVLSNGRLNLGVGSG